MNAPIEKMSISAWLAELHMECYKKYLEDFDTVKVSDSLIFDLSLDSYH